MKYAIKNPDRKHLIVLVHGLNGSEDTWQGNAQRFVENFREEQLIQENFNVVLFTYGTKIFKMNKLAKVTNTLMGFLKNRPFEDIKGFNVGIEDISEPLETMIREESESYDSLAIIAHSMGGLVVKSALSKLNEGIRQKVNLFISLSVPHVGAHLAKIGSQLLGDNPQIIDLRAMGNFTTKLNDIYYDLSYQPRTIYQWGNQDAVVHKASAIHAGTPRNMTIRTADDHFSVVLIKDRQNNILFRKILRELAQHLQAFVVTDIAVPNGVSFGDFVEVLASRLKFTINFDGFSDKELSTELTAGEIQASNDKDLLTKVKDLTPNGFPAYTIKQEGKSKLYTIKKTSLYE